MKRLRKQPRFNPDRAMARAVRSVVERLEQRVLLSTTPLAQDEADAIKAGLQGVSDWAQTVETFSSFGTDLPLIGQSLTDVSNFAQLIQDKIGDALDTLDATPNSDEIRDLLLAKLGAGSTVDIIEGGGQLKFDVDTTLTGAPVNVNLNLGSNGDGVGFGDGVDLSITGALDLNFTFGIDLADGLAASERFFVLLNADGPDNPTGFKLSASIDADPFQFSDAGKIGFASITVGDNTAATTFNLDAGITLSLADPDATDGHVTLDELLGNSLSSLAPITATGSVTASIPISATIGTFDASGTVAITDTELFDTTAPGVSLTGLDAPNLKNFNNLTPATLISTLDSLGASIQTLAAGLNPGDGIPFVDNALNQIVDFADAIRNFTGKLYDTVLGGAQSYVSAAASIANGKLPADLEFDVGVNGGALANIKLTVAETAGNDELSDLIGQINAKLLAAGSPVTAAIDGVKVKFEALAGQVMDLKYEGNQAGMLALGFASQISNALFRFETIQQLAVLLDELTPLDLSGINLDYDPTDTVVAFNIKFDREVSKELHLHFLEDLEVPILGTLSLAGGAHAHVHAGIGVDFRVGIDLTSDSFALDGLTELDTLNGGSGVPTAGPNLDDFRITRSNGDEHDFSLEGITTIQQLMDLVNAGGFLTLDINPDGTGLRLKDNTTPIGTGTLKVEKLNGSVAAQALGIFGTDHDHDGFILGSALHGDSLLKRAFIEEGGSITATASISSGHGTDPGLSLRASLSLLELGIEGDANFSISASATLEDPGTVADDGRITPGEFLATTAGGLLAGLVDLDVDATGDISGNIIVEGLEDFGVELGSVPTIAINFIDDADSFDISPVVNGLEDLLSFNNFSTDDLFALVQQGLEFLRNSDLALFNDKLPLIDKSINDILGFVDGLAAKFDEAKGKIADLKTELLARLNGPFPDGPAIKEMLLEAPFVDHLPQAQIQKLLDGVEFLEDAVQSLPDTFDADAVFKVPGKLMASMSLLRSAITDILTKFKNDELPFPGQAEKDAFKAKLDELRATFADTSNLLPAVQKFGDFIFKALGLQLPDFAGAIALVRDGIEQKVTELQEDAEDFTDEQLANLIAARDKIVDAVENESVTTLLTALEKFRQGIIDFRALVDDPDTDPRVDALEALLTDFVINFAQRVGFKYADDKLEMKIGYDISLIEKDVELAFDLDGGAIPVQLTGDGQFKISLGADLQLDFGIDLTETISPVPYLLPSTFIRGSALLAANDLTAELSIGGISAITLGGPGTMIGLSDGANPATLTVGFTDPGGGRIEFDQILGALDLDASGEFNMTVPVTVLTETVDLTGSIPDLENLAAFEIDFANLLDKLKLGELSLLEFIQRIPEFLDLLSSTLQSDILAGLPLVGDKINFAGDKLGQFNDKFIKPIEEEINNLIDGANDSGAFVKEALQKLFFDTLGPGMPANDTFDVLPGDGLDILSNPDGSKITAYTEIDVQVIVDDNGTPDDDSDDPNLATDPNAEVLVNLRLNGTDTLKADFALGLSALNLLGVSASGGIEIGVGFDLRVGFGINKAQGFFVNLPTGPEPDLAFNVDVGFDDEMPAGITAKLFFLDITATDNGGNTGFTGLAGVDFDHVALGQKVLLKDIPSMFAGAQPVLTVDAVLDAHLVASINGDPSFPSIHADLLVEWGFDLQDPSAGDAPEAALTNIYLDLGTFLSAALTPLVEGLNEFLTPIRPLIDLLNLEIPIISQLSQLVGQGPFTFLDGIGLFGEGGDKIAEFLRIVSAADQFIDDIAELLEDGPTIRIAMDDFDFVGDLRSGESPTIPAFDPVLLGDALDKIEAPTPEKKAATKSLIVGADAEDGLGLKFPIFTNPASILNLLFGGDIDLITWDVPRLAAKFEFSQIFGPVIPPFPIFATIGGGFEIFADFFIGMDTRGIRTGNFLNSFYFGDLSEGSTGSEVPELGVNLELTAGAELNIGGIVVAGIEGGISAQIRADWNDPDGNGKVYLDELLMNLQRGIECIFDLSGELAAFLRAYLKVEIDLGLFNITLVDVSFTLVEVTLFSFTVSCPPLPPPEPARMDGSTLLLNVGPDAGKRRAGDTDGDEIIIVRGEGERDGEAGLSLTVDLNNDGKITEEELGEDLDNDGQVNNGVLAVIGFGQTRLFGRDSDADLDSSFFKSTTLVTQIKGDGGIGDDEITLELVHVPASLSGGDGDDVLVGSSAKDTLSGGEGDDQIVSGAGNDTVTGGGGADEIFGNDGADTISGGDGDDSIYGGNNNNDEDGDGADSLTGGAGNDQMYGHAGNDSLAGGDGADFLGGSTGDDDLFGGNDNDTVLGEDGADDITGDAGDDQLKGGNDNDTMSGGSGNDWMSGGQGDDSMRGNSGQDSMVGGGSDDTSFDGNGNDVMFGDSGNDIITGDDAIIGSVTLLGGAGSDSIEGGTGSDLIYGQGGRDIIYGDDWNEATSGANSLTFDSANVGFGAGDTIHGNDGEDIIVAGDGGDSVFGGDDLAIDLILGDHGSIDLASDGVVLDVQSSDFSSGGHDTLRGGQGNDIEIGGFGADSILGNEGGDLILGDHGRVERHASGDLKKISSTGTDQGGNDTILGYDGDDTVLGGIGNDSITGNAGFDILLGDNGDVNYDSAGVLTTILSTNVSHFGDDFITGAANDDTIIGGSGKDELAGGGQDDIFLGDNGQVTRAGGFVTKIETTNEGTGDEDIILGESGADSAFGGDADDSIRGGDDASTDVLAGDNGFIDLTGGVVTLIESTDPTIGGEDSVWGGAGDDMIVGGSGGNDLTSAAAPGGDSLFGEDGNDIMIGDNARITRHTSDQVLLIETIISDRGGHDTMFGGAGGDSMLGGFGRDSMEGGDAGDVMLGDNGLLDYRIAGLPTVLQHITTNEPNDGDSDIIKGQDGNDSIMGGTNDEDISGGNGDDLIFGDHGEIFPPQPSNDNFFSIDTANADDGGADTIHGDDGDDTILGGQQGDSLFGDAHHDDIIGGHNNEDDSAGPRNDDADTMDGGTGDDAMAGDNAHIVRQFGPDYTSPLVRRLNGSVIYDADGVAQVTTDHQENPTGAEGRNITLLDHSESTAAGVFGADLMAGAADDDTMFGQLGNDEMRGDGFIDTSGPSALALKSAANATDGDDYMEGNGGEDLMFGDLGQDDMAGGSSDLFGLSSPNMRPDGDDTMYGGDGTDTARNTTGNTTTEGHARDADLMMGDNANIFRLVSGPDGAVQFMQFNYDNATYGYSPVLKIIPRASTPLDYDPVATPAAAIGGQDLMHGEAGDDSMHGMTGHDTMFGEGQDDDMMGGLGNDWASGGTGQDGVIGDDGRITTSRNGFTEPLSGVSTATTAAAISTPGKMQEATIHVNGTLKKVVNLTPFSADPDWAGMADEFADGSYDHTFDDIIYGGWGSDSLHGGSGDDAISGAEALPQAAVLHPRLGIILSGYDNPVNLGDMLAFNPEDADAQHFDRTRRAGEFAHYDEYNPRTLIQINDAGTLREFLLNFDPLEGPVDPSSTSNPKKNTDGDDKIFGDLGNDWMVGGTGRDALYGGWGNDLMNVDDDHGTNGGANDTPDTDGSYEDRAYGGAGRDVLIGNTGGDRLIDWVGEFNSYLVPFAPFGMATVSRTLQPQLAEFLLALSAADGADPTRAADTGADPLRNGEPEGELGMVRQKDAAWRQQTGAPADPQAGNIPGGKRDVLRSANFNGNQQSGFVPETGLWSISGGRYHVQPETTTGEATSLFYVDNFVPTYFEVLATIQTVKPTGGFKANSYLLFDYQSPTDFKFAGINGSTNKVEIGRRTASGWIVDKTANIQVKHGQDYNLFLAVNGNAVTLIVNNSTTITHAFTPRLDADGFSHTISEGMVGIGANGAKANIDNVVVQQVQETIEKSADFSGPTDLLKAPETHTWSLAGGRYAGTAGATQPAINLFDLRVGASALLELESTFQLTSAGAEGGFVFDYYGAKDYKFVMISGSTKKIVLGHRARNGNWIIDNSYNFASFKSGVDYQLGVTLRGTTANVTLNGQTVISHVFNSLVTDGEFGLIGRVGTTSFDSIIVRSDDPSFEEEDDDDDDVL